MARARLCAPARHLGSSSALAAPASTSSKRPIGARFRRRRHRDHHAARDARRAHAPGPRARQARGVREAGRDVEAGSRADLRLGGRSRAAPDGCAVRAAFPDVARPVDPHRRRCDRAGALGSWALRKPRFHVGDLVPRWRRRSDGRGRGVQPEEPDVRCWGRWPRSTRPRPSRSRAATRRRRASSTTPTRMSLTSC